jgi:hypothetical protein
MAAKLPYRATTATGDRFDFEFTLHEETGDPVRVSQMLSAILGVLDRDLQLQPDTSNGDLLQALTMALAVRTRLLFGDSATAEALCKQLLQEALDASREVERQSPAAGHA